MLFLQIPSTDYGTAERQISFNESAEVIQTVSSLKSVEEEIEEEEEDESEEETSSEEEDEAVEGKGDDEGSTKI